MVAEYLTTIINNKDFSEDSLAYSSFLSWLPCQLASLMVRFPLTIFCKNKISLFACEVLRCAHRKTSLHHP